MKDMKKLRKAMKVTQLKMAVACGIERARVSLIEGGARPSRQTADKIAKFLGVHPAEIFKNYESLK